MLGVCSRHIYILCDPRWMIYCTSTLFGMINGGSSRVRNYSQKLTSTKLTFPSSNTAFMFRAGGLPKLDLHVQLDRGADFKAWKTQWKVHLDISGLAEQEAAKQVKALTLCFSRETVKAVENLGLTDEQRNDVKTIVKAIQRYVEGHQNESVERRMFRQWVQQPGECFDDFLVSLRELAKTCNFYSVDCTQKMCVTK